MIRQWGAVLVLALAACASPPRAATVATTPPAVETPTVTVPPATSTSPPAPAATSTVRPAATATVSATARSATAPAGVPTTAAPPSAARPGIAGQSDGSCPAAYPIKGNKNSGIYHVPGGAFYAATKAEQCFATGTDAQAAGYRPAAR